MIAVYGVVIVDCGLRRICWKRCRVCVPYMCTVSGTLAEERSGVIISSVRTSL